MQVWWVGCGGGGRGWRKGLLVGRWLLFSERDIHLSGPTATKHRARHDRRRARPEQKNEASFSKLLQTSSNRLPPKKDDTRELNGMKAVTSRNGLNGHRGYGKNGTPQRQK